MNTYRKLTNQELQNLLSPYGLKDTSKGITTPKNYLDYFKTYYPPSAFSALVSYHSEYNDNTYDNTVAYVAIYDEKGDELLPIKGKGKAARAEWSNMFNNTEDSNEPLEDRVILIKTPKLPDLYILEP